MALLALCGGSLAMGGAQYAAEHPIYPHEYPMSYPGSEHDRPPAGESAFFTKDQPREYGTLVDLGPADPGYIGEVLADVPGENGLWIADGYGQERRVNLNVPVDSWANQEIIPSHEGDMTVYYRYPTGEIKSYNMGYVRPHHRYWMWFYGDVPGTYQVWYTIGGVYTSNYIWYHLWNDWPWWYGGYTYTYYTTPTYDWVYYENPYYYYPVVYSPVTYYTPGYVVYDGGYSMSSSMTSSMSTSLTGNFVGSMSSSMTSSMNVNV
ncbi:MAG: hypothetical protein GKC10_05535 [Methanosarcinales archaeon]|nr:hypothetical protein [Methanosarcinales archaeon]